MPRDLFSRYRDLPVIEVDGIRSLAQRAARVPVSAAGAASYRVVGEETLDQIAFRFYGHEELWWRIADANPTRMLFELRPGDTLVIPSLPATATRGG